MGREAGWGSRAPRRGTHRGRDRRTIGTDNLTRQTHESPPEGQRHAASFHPTGIPRWRLPAGSVRHQRSKLQ
jgi:hypothetical protein